MSFLAQLVGIILFLHNKKEISGRVGNQCMFLNMICWCRRKTEVLAGMFLSVVPHNPAAPHENALLLCNTHRISLIY